MHRRWGKPHGGVKKKRTLQTAWHDYQACVVVLAKLGFTPTDVLNMCNSELNSWIESYLKSQGIKQKTGHAGTKEYKLLRRKDIQTNPILS